MFCEIRTGKYRSSHVSISGLPQRRSGRESAVILLRAASFISRPPPRDAGSTVMNRVLCFVGFLAGVGCGNSNTSPVAGVVLLDGKPAANVAVQFVPQSESGHDAT